MRKVLLGVFLLATFTMNQANAAASTDHAMEGHELLFGTSGVGTLQVDPATTFTFALSAGYQRMVMPMLQVGIRGFMGIAATPQAWKALVWGTWNFDEKTQDAMFIGLGAGVHENTGLGFAAAAEIGKRFEVCHGLTYRPTVEVQHTFVTGGQWDILFNVINFSYMW